ncbi:L,D-transpeptidase [Rhizobium halophytocola]|uniref:Lipoprotein-anchoring transpeptidase ErfK/SrfK n=1 Tax=Rhizobium halophytocola TaxID=735519 RepID=A0ABS4DXR2_9HYPH|nr:L,D-transpeptidase [Rhizobium halophytocola]MBP1850484.1 lipoprotein-anchoring transpeptidase ErfK/SrfK [Rhizobium halophytocola]
MKISLMALAAAALVAVAGPAAANDRYQQRPPVVVSPDLTAPWVLQLGGRPPAAARAYAAPRAAAATAPAPRRAAPLFAPRAARQVAVNAPRPVRNRIDPRFLPQIVAYDTTQKPGTIVIDTNNRFLYLVLDGGKARRYGVGVGKPGFAWAGTHKITAKREWPGWTPPQEMLAREAAKGHYLPAHMDGGPENPLGARAMYLGSTMYRIHGTNAPWTIGYGVSSGCIRMRNEDVTDLYSRVDVGTSVIVM